MVLVGLCSSSISEIIMYALFYSSDVNEGAYGTYCLGGNRIGFVRYIQFFRCGALGVGWTMEEYNFDRWFLACVYFLSLSDY